MNSNKLLLFIAIIALFSSCKKTIDNPVDNNSMANMTVPADFDWSTTTNSAYLINAHGASNGSTVVLYDLGGNILDKQRVFDQQATFTVRLENQTDSLRVYSPETHMSTYFLSSEHVIDLSSSTSKASGGRVADYALSFDETIPSWVDIDNETNGSMIVDFPFTFSVWFKTSGSVEGNHDMALVSLCNPMIDNRYYNIYLNDRSHGGSEIWWRPAIATADGYDMRKEDKNMNVADDTWHQLTGVFTATKRTLYLDGNSIETDNEDVNFESSSVRISFGRRGGEWERDYYHGLMDNVQIWNQALDGDEVEYYYTNTPELNDPNLRGYYDFNEGEGNTVFNSVPGNIYHGNSNNCTYVLLSAPIEDADGDGVSDEDDDFPNDPDLAYNTEFPAGSNYYFHMFEDLWPGLGDYDFNDVILKTKINTYKNAQNELVSGRVRTQVYWIGGGIPRGIGMEWMSANEDASQLTYMDANTIDVTEVNNVITDPLVNNAVQIFNENIINSLDDSVDFEFSWDAETGGNNMWVQVYIYNDRDHEVHMYGHAPTNAMNMELLGTRDDASQTTWDWTAGTSFSTPADFYHTATNLPWGLEVVAEEFYVPVEKTEIIQAYPLFRDWAESGGSLNQNWYESPDEASTFLPSDL